MSWKIGPLLIAIASASIRLVGDPAIADLVAMAYLANITAHMLRSVDLRLAVRAARS
jgi:hypothetical protein